MNRRKLGNSDLHVSPVCLGGNVFGWTLDESSSCTLLDAFVAAGGNFIDTADVYSRWKQGNEGGESEKIIGKWLKQSGNRPKVVVATKVGSDMGKGEGKTLRKDYILKEADASLRRLQTDYIDLYQTHYDDTSLPVEEALEAYHQLVKAGKVKWIGTSNMSPARLLESLDKSESHGYVRYQTLQPEYNLYARAEFEENYQQICIDHNIAVISYYSLASGFLTGKYRGEKDFHKSQRGPGIKKYLDDRGYRILSALDAISRKYNTAPATVSLAWLMAQPAVVAPIASATNRDQLRQLTDATHLQLDTEAMEMLTKASNWQEQPAEA